jgi:transcription elongation factor GreA
LKEVILTADGYKKLQQEIDVLRNDKRREVAERIRIAREFGDIAENAEYDDAKNEQAMLEHKIAQLEERLLSARVITKKEISKDAV